VTEEVLDLLSISGPPEAREYFLRSVKRLSRESRLSPEDEVRRQAEKEETERNQVLESISEIRLEDGKKILFFLGAGASKPAPSNIPTVNELLPELWKKSGRLETKPLERLEHWCVENGIENIEEMLTAVTVSNFIIRNSKVHGLLNSVLYPEWASFKEISIRDIDAVLLLENMLNTFFSLLVGTMLKAKPNPIHESISEFAKSRQALVNLMTTNYDACMEQALDRAGVPFSFVLASSEESSNLKLIKMHGSINWFYCDACQNVFLPPIGTIVKAMENDVLYAVLGMCNHCGAPARQFIIPPITYKYLTHPPIVQVWEAGRRILGQSSLIIIVGYSFSAGDDYIAKMLVKAIGEDPGKRIIVVSTNRQAIERAREFIRSHVSSFDETKSFLPLLGDGVTLVPQIVAALGHQPKKSGK